VVIALKSLQSKII